MTALARFLSVPKLYSWISEFLGGSGRALFVREFVRPDPGSRILDIGCGPADIVDYLPGDVVYVGFDTSSAYIQAAKARYGNRATFSCHSISAAIRPQYRDFDIAMANGVLHHLDDPQVLELLLLAKQGLRAGGRFVSLDGCYVPQQSIIAKWLLDHDRGRFVRTPNEYVALATRVFGRVLPHVRHDLNRFPYTHLIMECGI